MATTVSRMKRASTPRMTSATALPSPTLRVTSESDRMRYGPNMTLIKRLIVCRSAERFDITFLTALAAFLFLFFLALLVLKRWWSKRNSMIGAAGRTRKYRLERHHAGDEFDSLTLLFIYQNDCSSQDHKLKRKCWLAARLLPDYRFMRNFLRYGQDEKLNVMIFKIRYTEIFNVKNFMDIFTQKLPCLAGQQESCKWVPSSQLRILPTSEQIKDRCLPEFSISKNPPMKNILTQLRIDKRLSLRKLDIQRDIVECFGLPTGIQCPYYGIDALNRDYFVNVERKNRETEGFDENDTSPSVKDSSRMATARLLTVGESTKQSIMKKMITSQ